MNTVEKQAEGIGNSLNGNPEVAAEYGRKMIDGLASDTEIEKFYEVAQCIVEPTINDEQATNDYIEFMEADVENWASWIGNTFGSEWGEVAKVVAEYGY